MRTRQSAAVNGLIALLFVASACAPTPEHVRSHLASAYKGTFQWDRVRKFQRVSIELGRPMIDERGKIVVLGKAKYVGNAETFIDVKWEIDPASQRFEMWELNPDRTPFETNGSHVGRISADLKYVTATWTTAVTHQTGQLTLKAIGR